MVKQLNNFLQNKILTAMKKKNSKIKTKIFLIIIVNFKRKKVMLPFKMEASK